MARKNHPHIGKYTARYEYDASNEGDMEYMPQLEDTMEEALSDYLTTSNPDTNDVVYIFKCVAVKRIVQPAYVAEDYVPEVAE
jgi:hypothetical protein